MNLPKLTASRSLQRGLRAADFSGIFQGQEGGIRPQGNGDGEKVSVPPSATVKPDTSRTKEYVSIDKGTFRTTAVLKCPCIVGDQKLWGFITRSFTNAFEGDNTLSCPTQVTTCDHLLTPPRCTTRNRDAKGSDYDKFTTS